MSNESGPFPKNEWEKFNDSNKYKFIFLILFSNIEDEFGITKNALINNGIMIEVR